VTRLIALSISVTAPDLNAMKQLRELATDGACPPDLQATVQQLGMRWYTVSSEGFWGESVVEFALGLTLCGLRRIPQLHHEILTNLAHWDYQPTDGIGQPGKRGAQFGDEPRFTNGTIADKRVRIVGAGNIASRYARFTRMLGADMPTLRERVLANELSLAADVWDVEPLPLDDPLLGRANVVHTPHNAGRTIHANQQFAEHLAAKFSLVTVR